MFPFGDDGFDIRLPLGDVRQRGRKRKFVSLRQYYRYFLYPRDRSSLIPFGFCRLFQQFVVDAWALIDQEQLNYIYHNQKTIRKDIRTGLSDAVFHHDVHPRDLGQSVLPASYTGSPRFMSRCYQDSMAIVRYFGRPAFFVTFTANPHWPEIQRELEKTPGLLLSYA